MSVRVECGFSNDEVLNIRYPLHRACRDGDVGALCSLLQCTTNLADLITEDSFYGWTPIHWAAHVGKLECVMRLVQVGCEVNAMTTRFAQTPAHIAAFGGHPECVLWLLQAGADINRQDYVGETPLHKAARAGSMECVNALLIQSAKPDLRNANDLTAADLAHAQGFWECAQLLSNAQNHLNQLNGFHANGALNGHCSLGQSRGLLKGLANRKRLLDGMEPNHIKKARTDGVDLPTWMQHGCGEELETMYMESAAPDPVSDDPKATMGQMNGNGGPQNGAISTNGHMPTHLNGANAAVLSTGFSRWGLPALAPSTENGLASSPLANQEAEETRRRSAHEMCGSLHLTGSPSSCVSHRPSWESMASDPGDTLHYGHYHGFGDTAEDLAEEHSSSVRVEQRYDQAVLSTMHFYHGS
ncbi:ankyrin repeat domain-containing protein 10-like [Coregonus clupeaformis]|uniref:ankyrin repeat domain-containing protein 10-like n=1 Tax=Coregonus clupeaformis TaxID=59861 RepID=UPI001E1C322E|nr:ankyrin repeat domain-containing protein 10-like [Coregonus clupeaformis]